MSFRREDRRHHTGSQNKIHAPQTVIPRLDAGRHRPDGHTRHGRGAHREFLARTQAGKMADGLGDRYRQGAYFPKLCLAEVHHMVQPRSTRGSETVCKASHIFPWMLRQLQLPSARQRPGEGDECRGLRRRGNGAGKVLRGGQNLQPAHKRGDSRRTSQHRVHHRGRGPRQCRDRHKQHLHLHHPRRIPSSAQPRSGTYTPARDARHQVPLRTV